MKLFGYFPNKKRIKNKKIEAKVASDEFLK